MKEFTPEDKVTAARLELVTSMPFYGSIFLRMNVFEDPDCPTAWTDGKSIGYNLEYVASLEHTQIIGLFVHECLHVILKHHIRNQENPDFKAKHKKWNYAADYSLNPVIKRSKGMDIHPNWLYNSKWDDELAEVIFYELKDSEIPPDLPGGGWGEGMPGEVRPMPSESGGKPTPAEVDAEAQKVDQWVKAAAFKAQGAGKLPGEAQDVIKAATAPTVCWQDELIFICDEITKNDYTWTRPNVRYMGQGVYLPSMHGQKTQDMIFFVDCSGSVDNTQLAQCAAEIQTIVSAYNIRVIVVYWDTKFRSMEIFDASDVVDPEFSLNIAGRGGTRFSGCWDWMDENLWEHDIDPKAMIFFSDLECSEYPADDPEMPVVWAQLPYGGHFDECYIEYLPSYGKHVRVPIYGED
jgi:predicted metal-dependent peptidase